LSSFTTFEFDEKLNQVLEEIGYSTPTPIQMQAIPIVLQGRDVLASAQTGTGKTASFLLPALHKLCDPEFRGDFGPQVVVLVPTRELAMQVAEESKKFSKHLPRVKTVCIYGGVPYPLQKKALSSKYEILVATPGRLIDHMQQGRINFSNVKMFILDEADRMLDMGFLEAVEEISNAIPKTRQTLLFSATIDKKILPVSRQLQNEPHEIRIQPSLERQNAIEQKLYYVDNVAHKLRILENIIENTVVNQCIIFTSTIRQTGDLADHLQEKGYRAEAINGDLNQRQRSRAIEKLREGKTQFLVATDVAARGIDILTLTHVINFDLPFVAEDFVHRIGRTGRAGGSGVAITFATYKEKFRVSNICKVLGKVLEEHTIPGFEPTVQERRSFSRDRNGPGSFSRGPRPAFKGNFRGNRDSDSSERAPRSFNKGPSEGRDSAPFSRGPRSFNKGPSEGRESNSFPRAPRAFNSGEGRDAAPFPRGPRSFNKGSGEGRDAAPFPRGPRSFNKGPGEGREFSPAGPRPFRGPSDDRRESSFPRKEGSRPFSSFGKDKPKTQWRKTPAK
jgi:superfamily II DNA/RNA helicase